MSFHIVIPARLASSRLPRKVLLPIGEKPMVQHAFLRAQENGCENIIVATENDEVASTAKNFGANVLLTSDQCRNGSERVAEVVHLLNLPDDAIVVNLQADEPFVHPILLNQVADLLAAHPESDMATLLRPARNREELSSPHAVKVACDAEGHGLYFSRSMIPGSLHATDVPLQKYSCHVGIYAYRAYAVKKFYYQTTVSPLETLENLEQLRVLWMGGRIITAQAKAEPPSEINTPEDLKLVEAWYEKHAIPNYQNH